jgi:hypothetical protein
MLQLDLGSLPRKRDGSQGRIWIPIRSGLLIAITLDSRLRSLLPFPVLLPLLFLLLLQ